MKWRRQSRSRARLAWDGPFPAVLPPGSRIAWRYPARQDRHAPECPANPGQGIAAPDTGRHAHAGWQGGMQACFAIGHVGPVHGMQEDRPHGREGPGDWDRHVGVQRRDGSVEEGGRARGRLDRYWACVQSAAVQPHRAHHRASDLPVLPSPFSRTVRWGVRS